jgi:glycosyltransferase involved in cell wall biosynthesis
MLRDRWYRWSLMNGLSRLDAMVVVGRHQRDRLLSLGAHPSRVHVVPCGVPTDEFLPVSERQPGPLRIICVARLAPPKGIDILLRALALLPKRHAAAELCVIGEGAERPKLEALAAELGLTSRVHFTGAMPSRDVRGPMAQADIFVQHSIDGRNGWTEGFGVSIAEASACGLPVLVTDCGGIPDQITHGVNGLIVRQRDIHGTADALLKLADDPALRRRLGDAGRRRAVELFDTAGQIRKLEDIVLDVIRNRAATAGAGCPGWARAAHAY